MVSKITCARECSLQDARSVDKAGLVMGVENLMFDGRGGAEDLHLLKVGKSS